jgi:hypothetical protein
MGNLAHGGVLRLDITRRGFGDFVENGTLYGHFSASLRPLVGSRLMGRRRLGDGESRG